MSFSNYEQLIVIDGKILPGVQDVEGSYSISEKPVNVAGVGFVDALVNSPLMGNFSVNRVMTGADPLLEKNSLGKYKFDENSFSGAIIYDYSGSSTNYKSFGFTEARLASYSVTCNVGEIPQIKNDFVVYGYLGKNVNDFVGYSIDPAAVELEEFLEGLGFPVTKIYLNEIALSQDVTNAWKDGSLQINSDQYQDLQDEMQFYNGDGIDDFWIVLGKDAFIPSTADSYFNAEEPPDIQYPDQSSIKIKINDFIVDPVTSFSFSRTINLKPTYAIPRGSYFNWHNNVPLRNKNLNPIQVDTIYPIQSDINITMIAEDYEIREIKDRVQKAPKTDVAIEISDAFDHNTIINEYKLPNARLIGETISSTVDGELSLSLTFKGFETKNR